MDEPDNNQTTVLTKESETNSKSLDHKITIMNNTANDNPSNSINGQKLNDAVEITGIDTFEVKAINTPSTSDNKEAELSTNCSVGFVEIAEKMNTITASNFIEHQLSSKYDNLTNNLEKSPVFTSELNSPNNVQIQQREFIDKKSNKTCALNTSNSEDTEQRDEPNQV